MISQEAFCGPLLAITRSRTLDEEIDLANVTRFALGAAVVTEDFRKMYWTAEKLEAGTVWMNCVAKSNIETPFGGNKNSGIGREDGTEGLLEYLRTKNHSLYVAPDYDDADGLKG